MIEKTFDPQSVEPRVSAAWEGAEAFRAGRPDRRDATPYSIVIPPPNVTGSLHMGHALNNTLQDILCRFERMRGKDVLWQPGTDHAGIATQMVVERRMMEHQEPNRHAIGREKFVEKVWAWKEESGGAIVHQLKRLGASCDWSRERFTMDEGLSKAVVEIFVRLHEAGLIYKDKRLSNWDPKLMTVISDLEVVQEEKRGSFAWTRGDPEKPFDPAALNKVLDRDPNGHLYYFDYPLIDAAGQETGETITVATTRPETMLGDSGIAVHPEDERYKARVGRLVRLPLVGRLIPIVADEYSDPEKGTGAVKMTPAHDFNDAEVGKRHGLEVINIFDGEARLLIQGNRAFLQGVTPQNASRLREWNGVDRFDARKRVVAAMEAEGRLARIEVHAHQVPHGDRSGVPIEPWLTDQWYLNVKPLAARAMDAVRRGETRFVPANWEKTFFDWLENILPWCISRQLWWGHQIPAWYGPGINADSIQAKLDSPEVFIARTAAEAMNMARKRFECEIRILPSVPTGDELQDIFNQIIRDENAGNLWRPIWRDPDVLDTWFSSALWPYSTLGWPEQTPELAKYYPTSVVVTGFDIIFFWVARMMMTGLFTMNEVPFKDVYIHALVRDEKGAKMSKSKGNVVDPLGLMDQFGADALRFTLAAMAAQGRDIKLSTSRIEGYRNFGTKLWNAARFAEFNGCARDPAFDPKSAASALNRWIAGEAAKAVADVQQAIEGYRFNDAAAAAYRFIWNVVCDWYLELAKPVLTGENQIAKAETRAMVAFILDQAILLLHPFMPFITEELWSVTAGATPRASVAALAPWPELGGLLDAEAEAEIGWLVDLVTEVRSIRTEIGVPGGALVPLALVAADDATHGRVERLGDTLKRLARIDALSFADEVPKGSVQVIVRGSTAALLLEGVIDIHAEKLRLTKEIGRIEADVSKIDAKLGNPDFLSRAKEEVVEEQRERREEAIERLAKLQDAIGRL